MNGMSATQWYNEYVEVNTQLAAEKAKVEELELTFDLSQSAYERGTKAWQEATGKTMATPDTGDLVQFLLEKVEGLEEERDAYRTNYEDTIRQLKRVWTGCDTVGLAYIATDVVNQAVEEKAKVARLVGKLKDIVNEWESTGDEWADDMYPDLAATITEAATLLADSEEN